MRNRFNKIFTLIVLVCVCSSCKEKKIKYFDITLLINNVPGKEIDNGLKALCNYIRVEDSNDNIVLIPHVTIIRTDILPQKPEPVIVPVSSLNNFRKSLNLLSADNLMEDYDQHIPALKFPAGIYMKRQETTSAGMNAVKDPKIRLINTDDSLLSKIQSLRSEIANAALSGAVDSLTVMLYKDDVPVLPAPTDTVADVPVADRMTSTPRIPASATPAKPASPSKTIVDYGIYSGNVNRQGKMDSRDRDATLIFTQRHIIATNDPRQRVAEAGDRIVGRWINGELSHGKWFRNGRQIGVLYLGTTGN